MNKLGKPSKRILIAAGAILLTGAVAIAGIMYLNNRDDIGSPSSSETLPFSEIEDLLPEGSNIQPNEDGSYIVTNKDLKGIGDALAKKNLEGIEDMDKYLAELQKSLPQSHPDYKFYVTKVIDPKKGGVIAMGDISVTFPKEFYTEPLIINIRAVDTWRTWMYSTGVGYGDEYFVDAVNLLGKEVNKFDKDLKMLIKLSSADRRSIERSGTPSTRYRESENDEWTYIKSKLTSEGLVYNINHFTGFASGDTSSDGTNDYVDNRITFSKVGAELAGVSCGQIVDDSSPAPCFTIDGGGDLNYFTWQQIATGYNNTSLYLKGNNSPIRGPLWITEQDLSDNGPVELFTFIPDITETLESESFQLTQMATYWIPHVGGMEQVVVDQRENAGKVVSLGSFEFEPDQGGVLLPGFRDYREPNIAVVADAISFGGPAGGGGWNLDLTPPKIEFKLGEFVDGAFIVEAIVTDNVGVGDVYFIINGESYEMTLDGNGKYVVKVPGINGTDLDYYITAYDTSGNEAVWRGGKDGGYVNRGVLGNGLGIGPWSFYMGKGEGKEIPSPKPGSNLCNQYCGDPINTLNGNLLESVDVIDLGGLPEIDLDITYNSQGTRASIFGEGWTHSYNYKLTYIENSLFTGAVLQYPDGRQVQFDGASLSSPAGTFEKLTRAGDGFALSYTDNTTVRFNVEGDVTKIVDPNGNALSFIYSESNQNNLSKLTQIKSSSGRSVNLEYSGNFVSKVVSGEKVVGFDYDSDFNLVQITDARGNSTKYEYDGSHNILKKISAKGHNIYVNTYDELHRVTSQKAGDKFKQNYTYQENQTVVTDRYGYTARYQFTDGLFTKLIDEEGAEITYQYNQNNQVTQMTDPDGNVTRFEYDTAGNQVKSVDAKGVETITNYNNFGKPVQQKVKDKVTKWNYDSRGNLISITNPAGDSIRYFYDSKGQLVKATDFIGASTLFFYNSFGDLEKIQNPEFTVTRLEHDEFGKVTAEIDALGNRYEYEYDQNNNLVQVNGPLGYSLKYGYDKNNHLISSTDANGAVTSFEYDLSDSLAAQLNPLGAKTVFSYGLMNELISTTDPLGRITKTTYTKNYLVNSQTLAVGTPDQAKVQLSYSPTRQLVKVVDPNGNVTSRVLDEILREVKLTEDSTQIAATSEKLYDDYGNLVRAVDANGNAVEFEYDVLGRVSARVDQAGARTTYSYDKNSNLISTTDANGNTTKYFYDSLNRLTATVDPTGAATRVEYDLNGNVTRIINAKDIATAFEYDALGRVSKVVEVAVDPVQVALFQSQLGNTVSGTQYDPELQGTATNLVTTYSYDPAGNVTEVVDPKGNATKFEYDIAGRQTAVIDAKGNRSEFSYDLVGNLISRSDRNGNTTKFAYDNLNRVIKEVNAEGHVIKTSYDRAGNVASMIDAKGNSTSLRYNGLNQLSEVVDALGAKTKFSYDKVGNVLTATDPNNHTTSYFYDSVYNLTSSKNPEGHSKKYEYDLVGNVVSEIDANNNHTSYKYDSLNRLISAVDAMGGETKLGYDSLSNLVKFTDANSHTDHYRYDPVGRQIVAIDAEGNRSKIIYDANSNVSRVVDANGNQTKFSYDSLNRLISQTNDENEVNLFGYDHEGNMVAKVDADGVSTAYAYDKVYRLIDVNLNAAVAGKNSSSNVNTSYKYDPNGNLTQIINPKGAVTSFNYDALNRQIREVDALGNTWRYGYDNAGNKTSRIDAKGQATTYSYFADDRLAKISYANSTSVAYEYDAANNKISMSDKLGESKWSYDSLNRVTREIDSLGREKAYSYDAVGNITTLTYPNGDTVSYRYLANDQLSELVDPEGQVTKYNRDKVGNIISQINPNGSKTVKSYDSVYRPTLIENYDNSYIHSSFEYNYNKAGQIVQTDQVLFDAKPQQLSTTYQYDAIRRLTNSQRSDGVFNTYSYDRVGNRTGWVSNDDSTTPKPFDKTDLVYDYNKINQLIRVRQDEEAATAKPAPKQQVTNPGQTKKTTKQVPVPQVSAVFVDHIHQFINQLEAQKGKQITGRAYRDLMDQVEHISEVAEDGLLTQSEATKLVNKLIKSINDYAESGEIKSTGTANALITKLKDVADFIEKLPRELDYITQTIEVPVVNDNVVSSPLNPDNDPLSKIEYRYDANGNRVRREEYGPQGPSYQMTRYTYDPEDRIASITNFQTSKVTPSLLGSQPDVTLSLTKGGSEWTTRDITTMSYDGLGRRLSKTYDPKADSAISEVGSGAKTTEYLYNGLDVVALYSTHNGQYQQLYRDNTQQIVSVQRFSDESDQSGQQFWFHHDAIGSVVGVTSMGGHSENTRYEDFGQIVKPGNSETKGVKTSAIIPHNVFTYTGQELDPASGLYEFYSRAYDPEVGVWLQQDRYRGRMAEPMTINRYSYVMNDPIRYRDYYGYDIFADAQRSITAWSDDFNMRVGIAGRDIGRAYGDWKGDFEMRANTARHDLYWTIVDSVSPISQIIEIEANRAATGLGVTQAQINEIRARQGYIRNMRLRRVAEAKLLYLQNKINCTTEYKDKVRSIYQSATNSAINYSASSYTADLAQKENVKQIEGASHIWPWIPGWGAGYTLMNSITGYDNLTGGHLSLQDRLGQLAATALNIFGYTIAGTVMTGGGYVKTISSGDKLFGLKVGVAGYDFHVHTGVWGGVVTVVVNGIRYHFFRIAM